MPTVGVHDLSFSNETATHSVHSVPRLFCCSHVKSCKLHHRNDVVCHPTLARILPVSDMVVR